MIEASGPVGPEFLRHWVHDNPALADRRDLFGRWFTDPTPREDVADSLGIPLGDLLRAFNATAPLADPLPFAWRGVRFEAVSMPGVCDDIADDRFPLFGAPLVVRVYLTEPDLLPQGMFEAADWNYMDAGRPGFVGYAYGVTHGSTIYLAGLQSDLGVRYGYLFQGRGETSEIRRGDEVVEESTARLREAYESHVPTLRRTFQRYWIDVLLGAVAAHAIADGQDEIALLQFPLTEDENVPGTVVHRVYRYLPAKLGATPRQVAAGPAVHEYAVLALDVVRDHLEPALTFPQR